MGAGATAGPRERFQVPMQALPIRGFEKRLRAPWAEATKCMGRGLPRQRRERVSFVTGQGPRCTSPFEEGVQGFRLLRGWLPGAGALEENREKGRKGQPWVPLSTQKSPDPACKGGGGALKLGQGENREWQDGELGAGH